MTEPHATCSVEVGLLRKKPCGHAAVAECDNCQQPLCTEHAVAQLTDSGKRSGKFLCKECTAAQKEQEKSLAAVARSQEEKKKAAFAKAALESVANPGAKKPVAPAHAPGAPAAPATPAAKPAEVEDLGAIEFTPKEKK
jgi:hypothetical protein